MATGSAILVTDVGQSISSNIHQIAVDGRQMVVAATNSFATEGSRWAVTHPSPEKTTAMIIAVIKRTSIVLIV